MLDLETYLERESQYVAELKEASEKSTKKVTRYGWWFAYWIACTSASAIILVLDFLYLQREIGNSRTFLYISTILAIIGISVGIPSTMILWSDLKEAIRDEGWWSETLTRAERHRKALEQPLEE